jgi:O-antigen/teichoic acid export membrane protein
MAKRDVAAVATYAVAILLVSGSNFLMAPVLLRYLGVEEFSSWALLEPVILIALPFAGLGIQIGLLNELRRSTAAPGQLLVSHLAIVIVIGALCAALLLGSGPTLAILCGAIVAVEGAMSLFASYWRSINAPRIYAISEGGRSAAVLAVVAVLLWADNAPLEDRLLLYLTVRTGVGALFFVVSMAMTRWPLEFSVPTTIRAMRFGLPIVAAAAIVAALTNADRYALGPSPTIEVATYVAHQKLAQTLGSALAPFFTWFAPVAISRLGNVKDNMPFFRGSFYAFMSLNCALATGLWVAAPGLWPILFPGTEFDSTLFAVSLIGMVAFACGNPLSIGSLREGKTMISLAVAITAATVGLASIPILAASYWALGVAAGKSLALIAYSVAFGLHTHKTLKVSYPWPKVVGVLAISLLLAVLGSTALASTDLIPSIVAGSICASLIVGTSLVIWRSRGNLEAA